jgi:hypothetical protein
MVLNLDSVYKLFMVPNTYANNFECQHYDYALRNTLYRKMYLKSQKVTYLKSQKAL